MGIRTKFRKFVERFKLFIKLSKNTEDQTE